MCLPNLSSTFFGILSEQIICTSFFNYQYIIIIVVVVVVVNSALYVNFHFHAIIHFLLLISLISPVTLLIYSFLFISKFKIHTRTAVC